MSASVSSSEEKSKPGQPPEAAMKGTALTDIGLLSEVEHFSNGALTSDDIEIVAAHIDDRNLQECIGILEEAIDYHRGDTCLSQFYYETLIELVKGPLSGQTEEEWEALVKFDAFLIKDWSIYPEVRAVTRPIDEEEFENYENVRTYLVSIIWSCAGSTLATFFGVRFPTIQMSSVALQLLIAYTGKAMAYLPGWSFPIGFGRRVRFGSGPWNFKEQMLATCGMGVGNAAPYSQYVVIAMANKHFYGIKQANDFGFIILLTLSTNLMGFGLSGIFRVFLVYPVRMIWYTALPSLKLSRALVGDEKRENTNGWRLKGWEFFWIFSFVEFGWYWITGFVFKFLSTFDWVAWISHKNNNLLNICSVNTGLGLNPIPSFDWSVFLPTPLVSPFFASAMYVLGMFITMFGVIGLFYNNTLNQGYIPINDNQLYDNTAQVYDVNNVLDENFKLDYDKYQSYSPPFWSAGAFISYSVFFMFYPAMIMYSILNYANILTYSMRVFVKTIIHPTRTLHAFDDRFTRAQRKYKEVPEWWYILYLCVCLGMAIACVEHYSFTETPVWTIFFGVGLSAVFMVPCGVLYATTNMAVYINVLYELVIGLTVKGNGNALMVAKAYATNFMVETDTFLSNLKIGHYTGIAPRPMFRIQVMNMIANSFVQSGLILWQSTPNAIPDLCDVENSQRFTCQSVRTYFNAAVQWGTLGPERLLKSNGTNGIYPKMKWVFLIGAGYPIPFWIVRRFVVSRARKNNWGGVKEGGSRFRNSAFIRGLLNLQWVNSFNEMVIIQGGQAWAPTNLMYYWPWVPIGFIFQVLIPRYWPRWWAKYNYLLYAAITVGMSYSALIIFFATSYHHIASIKWWGNDTGIRLTAQPQFNVSGAPDGYFGPRKGHFP